MEHFEKVQLNVITNNIVKKHSGFERYWRFLKDAIISDEFNTAGKYSRLERDESPYYVQRVITKGSVKIYINVGTLCKTVAINNSMYYQYQQSSMIVSNPPPTPQVEYVEAPRRNSSTESRSSDSSVYINPSNPSSIF